ncbi:MAG: hypothetical protein WCX81_06625 [Monoglobales bacterium]
MRNKGDRVGAILSADKDEVRLLGYGTYLGDEVPPDGFMHEIGHQNPKIQLDNGDIVWGYQCWWGDEEQVKKKIGDRRVVIVSVKEEV